MYPLNKIKRFPAALRLFTVPVSILSIVAFVHSLAWDLWDDVGVRWERGNRFLGESAYVSVCSKPFHLSSRPVQLCRTCAGEFLKGTT